MLLLFFILLRVRRQGSITGVSIMEQTYLATRSTRDGEDRIMQSFSAEVVR